MMADHKMKSIFHLKPTNIPWFQGQQHRGRLLCLTPNFGEPYPDHPQNLTQHQKPSHLFNGALGFVAYNAFTEDKPQW